MKTLQKSSARQQGLSLVELMIALLLASILTVGLYQVFSSNSFSFRLNEASARAQESGRIASEVLGREIRGAGYFGCNVESVVNNLDDTDESYDPDSHSFDISAAVSSAAATRPADAIAGTHHLRLSGMENSGIEVRTMGPATSASFDITERGGLVDGSVIAISDCSGTDIFQVSSIQQGGGGNLKITVVANSGEDDPGNDFTDNGCTNCLANSYGAGAQILQPYNRTYFIGQSNTTGEPALMLQRTDGTVVEMVEGVVDMRIRMGTSNTPNNPVNQWTDVTGAISWNDVRAVQVSLLVRAGRNNLLEGTQNLCFPGWNDCSSGPNFTAPDNRMYRVYDFTMNVRNSSR
ncbi:PilW family protein [Marinobacter sp. C1S70]|uniref:PilW family protein n=1 Tax=Marinobacter sp. C1S70 TaxID=1396859 RepID=UPI001363C3F3|nr:PilW family protein [Marinobacter sp. C1S70]